MPPIYIWLYTVWQLIADRMSSVCHLLPVVWALSLSNRLASIFLTTIHIDALRLQPLIKSHRFKVLRRLLSGIDYSMRGIHFFARHAFIAVYETCLSTIGCPYRYQTLDNKKQSLRLLLLFPGEFDDDIRCSLVQTSLEDTPNYGALSYTWGDVAKTDMIWIGPYPFLVSSNLYDALKYLRYRQDPRYLWVDAISLNQNDINEQNHQVKQTTDIYRCACAVFVWLGRAGMRSDGALHLVQDLEDVALRGYSITASDILFVIESMRALGKLC